VLLALIWMLETWNALSSVLYKNQAAGHQFKFFCVCSVDYSNELSIKEMSIGHSVLFDLCEFKTWYASNLIIKSL
jgi:hypothetical protein